MDVRAEIRKLTTGELVIVTAAVLLFVDSFLPWFRYCVDIDILGLNQCATVSAWDNAVSLLAVLVAVAMATQIILVRFANVRMPELGTLTWGDVQLIAGVVVLALVVLKIGIGENPAQRWIGVYAAVVLALALLYGAIRRRRER